MIREVFQTQGGRDITMEEISRDRVTIDINLV